MPYLCIVLATPKGHEAASTIHKISSLGAAGYPMGAVPPGPHPGKRYLPLSAHHWDVLITESPLVIHHTDVFDEVRGRAFGPPSHLHQKHCGEPLALGRRRDADAINPEVGLPPAQD